MDGEPRYRTIRVHEDADEDGELRVPEPDDPGAALPEEYDLMDLRYRDHHPWRCGDCNQPVLPGWERCPMCGRFREDCEA